MKESLYILTGPTAVGKTQLSLDWALQNNAEIVSCDSLLFYKGMDIGTAKPTLEEQSIVPHHLIDLVEPHQQFNVGDYLDLAQKAVADILGRGKKVLITGGSGFYLKGFLAPVVDTIIIPEEINEEVNSLLQNGGLEAVVARLKRVAPDDFDLIDLSNSRRVVPALKRCLVTGLGIQELRERAAQAPYPFRTFSTQTVLLHREIEQLTHRIVERVDLMLEAGLVEEVRQLMDKGFEANESAYMSIGYREVVAFLKNEIDENEMRELISFNTVKLVKKQRKWFRYQIQFDRTIDLDRDPCEASDLFDMSV